MKRANHTVAKPVPVISKVLNQVEICGEYTLTLDDKRVLLVSNDGISIHENHKQFRNCLNDHFKMEQCFYYKSNPVCQSWLTNIISMEGLEPRFKKIFEAMLISSTTRAA